MGGVDRKNQTGRPLGARLLRVCLACWNFNPGNFQLHPPSPAPTQISELQCPQGSASCSVPCHGGAAAALHCPLGCCLCFPRSSSSCARRGPGSLRLGAGTVAEAGGEAGP